VGASLVGASLVGERCRALIRGAPSARRRWGEKVRVGVKWW